MYEDNNMGDMCSGFDLINTYIIQNMHILHQDLMKCGNILCMSSPAQKLMIAYTQQFIHLQSFITIIYNVVLMWVV